jgi:hypothetical protein
MTIRLPQAVTWSCIILRPSQYMLPIGPGPRKTSCSSLLDGKNIRVPAGEIAQTRDPFVGPSELRVNPPGHCRSSIGLARGPQETCKVGIFLRIRQ